MSVDARPRPTASVHRRTVRQALAAALPPPRRVASRAAPAVGPHLPTIRAWLTDDLAAPRKQQHTARRVWQRLVDEEGALVAESTVRAVVGGIKAELESGMRMPISVPVRGRTSAELIGGPIFRSKDQSYRGILVPEAFWKLFVYRLDGVSRAKAFVLTQDLGALERIELPDWKTYEEPIHSLETMTSLQFGAVGAAASRGGSFRGGSDSGMSARSNGTLT